MPINIIIGLVSLLAAIVLYTIATWSAFRAKGFSRDTVTMLWLGVVFDVLATGAMAWQIGGLDLRPGAPLLHTVLALLAMAGMVAGAAVATWAVRGGRDRLVANVSRWLLAPWALWVGVFVWGMVTRGAARMGA